MKREYKIKLMTLPILVLFSLAFSSISYAHTDEIVAQAMTAKERAAQVREEAKAKAEARRQEAKAKADAKKEEARMKLEQKKNTLKEKREEVKDKMKETKKEVRKMKADAYKKHFLNQLTVLRREYDKQTRNARNLKALIAKAEANKRDMTEAKTLFSDAEAKLATSKADIENAKKVVEASISEVKTQEGVEAKKQAKKANDAGVKEAISKAKESLRASHKALQSVIPAIRSRKTDAPANSATSTNSAQPVIQ